MWTHSRSHSQFVWITKATGGEKPEPTFFHLLFFFVVAITLALATINCVVRFSRFSPLTVLFCPSHDVSVCMCEWANEWMNVCVYEAIQTAQVKVFRVVYASCWSIQSVRLLLHKTSPNKPILFTFNRSFSAACVIRICLFDVKEKSITALR